MPRHDPPEANETEALRQTISLLELRLEQDRAAFESLARMARQNSPRCKGCEANEALAEAMADVSGRKPRHDTGTDS